MDPVAQIRSFNRAITRRLGALDSDSFLGSGISLGKARLLYEIGGGATEVRLLRAKLELDSGHMSRMLRSLEKQRLIETTVDPADARARKVVLTRAGKAKLAELDGKSNDGAESWLAPLSAANRARLQGAMAEVERLLKASEIVVRLADPRSAIATWCLEQFFRELGARFEGGFDRDVTKPASAEDMTPPRGCFLVAALPDQAVGCGGLKLDPRSRIGEIKRMWVSPVVRGLGVGRRLLEALEAEARRRGVELVRLETNRSLVEAQALYRTSGYTETRLFDDELYAHLAFEKRLR